MTDVGRAVDSVYLIFGRNKSAGDTEKDDQR